MPDYSGPAARLIKIGFITIIAAVVALIFVLNERNSNIAIQKTAAFCAQHGMSAYGGPWMGEVRCLAKDGSIHAFAIPDSK